jgi:succinate dehydrogenase / fumarate reductase cytochrome b subunit
MIGPYYRPQLTSMLSILHRITGILLTVVGLPMLMWWLIALGQGPEAYSAMQACLAGFIGNAAFLLMLFCLSYHFFNGIRHMIWDTGRGLELRAVYSGGLLVAAVSVVTAAILAWVTLWA